MFVFGASISSLRQTHAGLWTVQVSRMGKRCTSLFPVENLTNEEVLGPCRRRFLGPQPSSNSSLYMHCALSSLKAKLWLEYIQMIHVLDCQEKWVVYLISAFRVVTPVHSYSRQNVPERKIFGLSRKRGGGGFFVASDYRDDSRRRERVMHCFWSSLSHWPN